MGLEETLVHVFGEVKGQELVTVCETQGVTSMDTLRGKLEDGVFLLGFSDDEYQMLKDDVLRKGDAGMASGGERRDREPALPFDDDTEDKIRDFVMQAASDADRESLTNALRDIPKEDALTVMSKNYSEARNFAALVFAKIGALRAKEKIHRFIDEHNLREEVDIIHALKALRQKEITSCLKPLTDARDPPAVLRARINQIHRELGRPLLRRPERKPREEPTRKRRRSSSESFSRSKRRRASSDSISVDSQTMERHHRDIEDFVRDNINADDAERVEYLLKEFPFRQASHIMSRELQSAKNKTAVVFKRIKEANTEKRDPRTSELIDKYCRKNRLDDDTEDRLRQLPKDEARWVMDKDYSHMKDPASMVAARCKNARGSEEYVGKDERIEDFVRQNDLNEDEEHLIRMVDMKTLKKIMKYPQRGSEENRDRVHKFLRTVTVYRAEDDTLIGLDFIPGSLVINKTIDNTPAQRAGIKTGWRVLAVNDRPISTKEEAASLAGSLQSFTITFSTVQ